MANSKFEYIRNFELNDSLLRDTFIIVRVDGRSFHKFSERHEFTKPNDKNALLLMNRAALSVMEQFSDIILSYGQSDEYRKILSTLVSLFTSSYIFHWKEFFKDKVMLYPISFDGRVILYPTLKHIKDYLSWRQVDCHINNLYNTCYWTLVKCTNLTPSEAEQRLMGTQSKDKHEILFSEFGINYDNEEEIFKKGSIILRTKKILVVTHEDLIKEPFWKRNTHLFES